MAKSPQCAKVVQALVTRDRQPSAHAWFESVLRALDGEVAIDDDTLQQLEWRTRGDYGPALDHFNVDEEAHVWFWRTLFLRFPGSAWVQSLYADMLYLCGDRDEKRKAYALYLDAVRQDPRRFYLSAGEFHDFAKEEGTEAWFEYRLATLRVQVHNVVHGEMDADELRAELREMTSEFANDPEKVRQLLAAVRPAIIPW